MAALYKVASSARRGGTCLLRKPAVFLGNRFCSSGDEGLSTAGGEEEKQRSGFAAAYELHSEMKQQQDTEV